VQFDCIKKKSELEPKQPAPAKTNTTTKKQDTAPINSINKKETPVYNEYKSSSPSLKNITANRAEDPQTELQKEKKETANLPKQIFSNDELKTAWLRYAESIKNKMPRLYQVLQTHIPVKDSETTIKLQLDSESQKKDLMEKNNSELMKFLMKELSNYSFKLKFEVAEEIKSENLIYTSTDKFKYLLEKNQELNTLKEKFNLDFE